MASKDDARFVEEMKEYSSTGAAVFTGRDLSGAGHQSENSEYTNQS